MVLRKLQFSERKLYQEEEAYVSEFKL